MKEKTAWNVLAWISAIAMAWAGRQAASAVWSLVSDTETPVNPADRDVTWREALGWAALAGITAGLARVLGRRGAALAWERATGDEPPGI
jgi:hypothetical protein